MADVDMETIDALERPRQANGIEASERPKKRKLVHKKKLPRSERRRFQNRRLCRLLAGRTPQMALNELLPSGVAMKFMVFKHVHESMCKFSAILTLQSNEKDKIYLGSGGSAGEARGAAVEDAVLDLLVAQADAPVDAESLPMVQLASLALNKLRREWKCLGRKLLLPKVQREEDIETEGEGEAKGEWEAARPTPAPRSSLPGNAALMQPAALLNHMRPPPLARWALLAAEGDRPQRMQFTMAVDVDGCTYTGHGPNKRTARREAARAACEARFAVAFCARAATHVPVASTRTCTTHAGSPAGNDDRDWAP